MSASQTLGGPSRTGRVIGPSLDKIIKNASWRKHAHLVGTCKAALDRLETVPSDAASDPSSPLLGVPLLDAEFVLNPLILALDTASVKVIEPTLDCAYKLFSFGLIRGEIDKPDAKSSNFKSHPVLFRLLDAVSKVCSIGEEAVEVGVLRVFLAAVRSPCVLVRGDCLAHMVRTCYNVYLGGMTGTNQICAKAVLAQIMVIVFTRVEEDSLNVPAIRTVSVAELLEVTDKNLSEGNSVSFCQGFINEVMNACEGVGENKQLSTDQNGNDLDHKDGGGSETGSESGGDSKLREDGFLIFRNLCKLSMKYSSQENADDQILLRGKILSLELLKVIMDNGGPIWRLNERQVTCTHLGRVFV